MVLSYRIKKRILEGTGKKFRHFKVRPRDDLNNPDLIELLKYAVQYKVPPIKDKINTKKITEKTATS